MEIIELKCPRCGANIDHNREESQLTCGYCGYKALVVEDEDKNVKLIEQKSYAKAKGEYKAEYEYKIKKVIFTVIGMLIFFGLMFGWTYISSKIKEAKLPKLDPFEYLEVEFSGITGKGEATLRTKDGETDLDLSKIIYEISKDYELEEGNIITVTASTNAYRLIQETKKYEVKGLDLYLSDINEITQTDLETLRQSSMGMVKKNIVDGLDSFVSVEYTPEKIYFMTDGKNENELWDVYKAHFTLEDGSTTDYYSVAVYDDIIIRKGETASILTDKHFLKGNLINIKSESDYGGYMYGFESLEEAKAEAQTKQKVKMNLVEIDTRDM